MQRKLIMQDLAQMAGTFNVVMMWPRYCHPPMTFSNSFLFTAWILFIAS